MPTASFGGIFISGFHLKWGICLDALGIFVKGKVALTAEIYPDMENPKAIIIRRSRKELEEQQ